MSHKTLPLSHSEIASLADRLPTPFHLYDEKAIRKQIRSFKEAFSWVPEFKNYYAVKACPNPAIIRIMAEEGFGADCSSHPELLLARDAGILGEDIMFTSNDTPASEYVAAKELNAGDQS